MSSRGKRVLQFRQYGVIFLCERIVRCGSPCVYTEYHLRASSICGLGARGPQKVERLFGVQVTRPLPITPALPSTPKSLTTFGGPPCRKTTPYCLNCRRGWPQYVCAPPLCLS